MKKLLAIILCVALLACAFTFVACDDKDSDSNNGNSTANGESMLEDFVGKLATYILENPGEYGYDHQMNFELPEREEDGPSPYGFNWLMGCGGYYNSTHKGLYLFKFDSEESANANLSSIQNYFLLDEGGTYFVEGNVIIWDSGDGSFYNTIKNTKNKISNLLPTEVINRYKYQITSFLQSNDDNAYGYAPCVFEGSLLHSYTVLNESGTVTQKHFEYLLDNATEEEIANFTEDLVDFDGDVDKFNGTFTKVNDRFYWYEETETIEED